MKTIKGLESYIRTLPSDEDLREARARLEVKTSQQADTLSRLEDAEEVIRGLRAELQTMKRERLRLEIDNKELAERNKEMGAQVHGEERRRLEARTLDETQVELLIFDKEELSNENKKLKNLLNWKTNKFEEEKCKLEDQVRKFGNLVEETNKQLQVISTQLRETKASRNLLEVELKKKGDLVSSLSSKLERLGQETKTLRSGNETTNQLDGHFTRLTR